MRIFYGENGGVVKPMDIVNKIANILILFSIVNKF